ncbi:hypothetical protein, partial [Streptomyces clavifer]
MLNFSRGEPSRAFTRAAHHGAGRRIGPPGSGVTNGPNGVPNIPDLVFFGYDFGESHTILGIEL